VAGCPPMRACRRGNSKSRGSLATRQCGISVSVGTGYFDEVQQVISGVWVSTAALGGSTENEQFSALKKWRARR